MTTPPGRHDGETALLLAGPFEDAGTAACFEHLASDGEPPRRMLNVLFTRRPGHRVENWRHHVGDLPEQFVVLGSQEPASEAPDVDVERLADPGDLTSTGVAITGQLAEWPADGRTGFCLHSATAQLQYSGREQVYQFLHTLRAHLEEHGAVGHVHLNPDAHDDRTVDTFKTLFDTVLEPGSDGTALTTS